MTTEHDIDRLYGQMSDKDVNDATIVIFCMVAGVCIVVGTVIGYCLGGGM